MGNASSGERRDPGTGALLDFHHSMQVDRPVEKSSEASTIGKPSRVQFDLILLISTHGDVPISAIKPNSTGTYMLNPLPMPPDMRLTMMAASEIGICTIDYLSKFKEHLMSQIEEPLKYKNPINLQAVQKYFRSLRDKESAKDKKNTVKEFGTDAIQYYRRIGWHISDKCVERRYVCDYSLDHIQMFSNTPTTYKPIEILHQNPLLVDPNIDFYKVIADANNGNVTRSLLLDTLYKYGFRNICIFDVSCGELDPNLKQLLGIAPMDITALRDNRQLQLLRLEGIRDLTAGGKRTRQKRRKYKSKRRS
jgi:hypothetical protein